jgi:hypothetical protein
MPDPIDPIEPTVPTVPTDPTVPTEIPEPTETPERPTRFPDEGFGDADDDGRFVEDARPARSRREGLRLAGVVGARFVTGLVAVAVIGVTVAAAAVLPLPGTRSKAPSEIVTPVPAAQRIVCPGGLLRLADSEGKGASKASTLGVPNVASAATAGGVARTALGGSDAGTGGTAAAPQVLSTPPVNAGAKRSILAGAQSQSIATDEFFGLASAACTAAVGDAWLVGGSTSTGRTTLLTLANPSAVPATVTVQIFGENGAISAPGMNGIVIAAGGQRILSLAGFAPKLASPVVHVHSRGGQVIANLEQSTVRGLEAGGIDFAAPETSARLSSVIPGVQLAGTQTVQSRLGEEGFADLETVLRVYVPGTKGTTAHVSVLPEDPKADGTAFEAQLEAGKVTDLPIDELVDGGYTVVVTTSVPVVSGVRVSTAGSAAVAQKTDFAWLGASPPLRSEALVPIASGMIPIVHIQNPGKAAVTVKFHPLGATGTDSDLSLSVPAGSAASIPVSPGAVYRISGFSTVYAAVSGTTDGGVAGYAVYPSAPGSAPLRMYG